MELCDDGELKISSVVDNCGYCQNSKKETTSPINTIYIQCHLRLLTGFLKEDSDTAKLVTYICALGILN